MHWESGDKVFGFLSGRDLFVIGNHPRGNYNICFFLFLFLKNILFVSLELYMYLFLNFNRYNFLNAI